MKILALIFLFNGLYAHDIQVAWFKVHQENDNFIMEIVIEKDDVESTFDALGIMLTDNNLQDYIHENLSLLINEEKQTFCFEKIQTRNKHISLTYNIQAINKKIESLELKNTCFLNIENQSNIIEVSINERERDFLMNKERTSIIVTY